MLPLDSPRWKTLRHAYGPADDIPPLLRQLERFPPNGPDREPYHTLWSSLCHQGDVYPASYAAVPHMIRMLETDPAYAPYDLFYLPARIEIARLTGGPDIEAEFGDAYTDALRRIPSLLAKAATGTWDDDYCVAAAVAMAAAKGLVRIADAISELDSETIDKLLEWKYGN